MKRLIAAFLITLVLLSVAGAQTSDNGLKFKAERERFETTRASNRSKASLTGIWMRVYVDGEQFAEFSTPTSLKRGEWKE